MKITFLAAIFLLVLSFSAYAQTGCSYDKNGYRRVPRSTTLVTINAGSVKQIKGKIANFNNPTWVKAPSGMIAVVYRADKYRNTYIGSQVVDENGWFCFGDLPDGRYVLHLGGVIVWDTAEVTVTVKHAYKKAVKDILIELGMAI